VPTSEPCHRERVGNLDVIEYRRRSDIRPYGLRMEGEPETKEDAQACHHEAILLASDLSTVWPYVAGALFPEVRELKIVSAPDGWTTNFKMVESTLPTAQRLVVGRISITSSAYSITLPYMPLKRAIAALRAYRSADQNVKVLVDLHFEASNRLGEQSGLFLLAKALELARAILPGSTDTQRVAALSADVRKNLRQSFHSLYDIANNRLEIRHTVDKKNKKSLLPRLNHQERTDFVRDADLVIRGVVEREIQIPLLTIKQR